jgi:hypothetical protein
MCNKREQIDWSIFSLCLTANRPAEGNSNFQSVKTAKWYERTSERKKCQATVRTLIGLAFFK